MDLMELGDDQLEPRNSSRQSDFSRWDVARYGYEQKRGRFEKKLGFRQCCYVSLVCVCKGKKRGEIQDEGVVCECVVTCV